MCTEVRRHDEREMEETLVSSYPVITPITAVITHILRFWAGITKTTVTR